jgi:hypothetical protein
MPLPLTPSPANEIKTVAEMIGEYLREAAVLVGVFAILDKLVEGREVTWTWLSIAIAFSGVLLAAGIVIERSRKAG